MRAPGRLQTGYLSVRIKISFNAAMVLVQFVSTVFLYVGVSGLRHEIAEPAELDQLIPRGPAERRTQKSKC